MKKYIFIYILLFVFLSSLAYAGNVNIYYFYGDGCRHCAEAKPFLAELENKYPEITIKSFETWHNKSNSDLFVAMSNACGSKVVGVPTIFVGHKPIIGFDNPERKGKEIEEAVVKYIEKRGVDLMDHLG